MQNESGKKREYTAIGITAAAVIITFLASSGNGLASIIAGVIAFFVVGGITGTIGNSEKKTYSAVDDRDHSTLSKTQSNLSAKTREIEQRKAAMQSAERQYEQVKAALDELMAQYELSGISKNNEETGKAI